MTKWTDEHERRNQPANGQKADSYERTTNYNQPTNEQSRTITNERTNERALK